jgi:hypothetical protein
LYAPHGQTPGQGDFRTCCVPRQPLADAGAACRRLPAEVREASGAGGGAAGTGSAAAAAGSAAGAGGATADRRRRLHEHARPACCGRARWGCAGPGDGLPCRAWHGVRAAAATAARLWRRARGSPRVRGPAGGAAAGARDGTPAGGPQRRLQAEAEEDEEEYPDVDKSSAETSYDVVSSGLLAGARAGGAAGPPGAGGAGGALMDRQRLFSVRGTAGRRFGLSGRSPAGVCRPRTGAAPADLQAPVHKA